MKALPGISTNDLIALTSDVYRWDDHDPRGYKTFHPGDVGVIIEPPTPAHVSYVAAFVGESVCWLCVDEFRVLGT